MTQKSFLWDGASTGDADTYTKGRGYHGSVSDYQSPPIDVMFRSLWNGNENRGVLRNWLNQLAVTGAVSPISIDTGAAIVYGLFYTNTVAVNKVIVSPTTDTRYDRVVIRRDWTAQTARITVITGLEGGGIPALVQSPAPSGSGIYDIPLATLEITTGGVISIVDNREYCTFSTGYAVNAFASTHLTNDSIVWADRATRTKYLFLGGGDLQPNVNAGQFWYYGGSTYYGLTQVGPPVWGGAANTEAWRTTGAATTYRGLYGTFRLPADYAGGTITSYVWWVNNFVVAATFSIVTAFQIWPDSSTTATYPRTDDRLVTSITTSGAVSNVFRSAGVTIEETCDLYQPIYYATGACLGGTDIIHYFVSFYNTAGTEDIGIMGVEFQYTGYI